MQTIKTGVVVALLLAVCYGAFVALNAPEPDLPDELLSEFDWDPDDAGLESLTNITIPPTASSEIAALQPPTASTIDATGSLASFDATNLSLPALPPLGSPNANPLTSSLAPSVGLPSFPAANSQSNLDGTGSLAALPVLPGDAFAATPPTGDSGSQSLDGPAVPLAGSATGADRANLSAPVATGQLVSQSRPSNGSVGQLPQFDSPTGSGTQSDSNANSVSPQGSSTVPTLPFPSAREQALELASAGKLREALQLLSGYYDSPELTGSQHADLVDLLDALSREVVYSPRHLAESPHTVSASDTIETLSQRYQITPELLTSINRLGDSKALLNGSQLKVLPGPFRAAVSLTRHELTLFMGDLYAGRFPVSFGSDPPPAEGTFEVVARRRDRTYYGTGGKVIAASDNRNPYGGYWLNLGQDLCIHGTPEMASDDLQGAGCISLAPLDAADVYTILAQGSQVSIVR